MKTSIADWKRIDIKLEDKIPYVPMTEHWGRAEFRICPVFRRGKMVELYLYRIQQNLDELFVMDTKELNVTYFSITAWSHKTDMPQIWSNHWCKDHKCVSFDVYVPNDTDTIEFAYYFGNELDIRFVKKESSK